MSDSKDQTDHRVRFVRVVIALTAGIFAVATWMAWIHENRSPLEKAEEQADRAMATFEFAQRSANKVTDLVDQHLPPGNHLSTAAKASAEKLRDISLVRALQSTVDLEILRTQEEATHPIRKYSDHESANKDLAKLTLAEIPGSYIKLDTKPLNASPGQSYVLMVNPAQVENANRALHEITVATLNITNGLRDLIQARTILKTNGIQSALLRNPIRANPSRNQTALFVYRDYREKAAQLLEQHLGLVIDDDKSNSNQ